MYKRRCIAILLFFIALFGGGISACLISTIALASNSAASDLDTSIKIEEKRLETIKRQINYHKRQVLQAKKKEKNILKDLSGIGQNIVLLEQQIKLLNLKEKRTQMKIEELTKKISKTNGNIDSAKKILTRRLVALYKYGNVAQFNLILSASSAHEVLNNVFLLRRISEQDKRLISTLMDSSKRLEESKKELEAHKGLLIKQKAELESKKRALRVAQAKREELLKRISKRKELHMKAAKELQDAQEELKNKIRYLISKKRQLASRSSSAVLTYKGGKLRWPVRGKITSRFGVRVHPVFKTKTVHTGLDISAKEGSPVKAAADGEVLFTGWLNGYGQIIVLDHGSNLTTVYAHLSRVSVSEGSKVRAGQTIGNVGKTGLTTGAHLHFEVRVNGKAVDPMKYLRR